MFLTVRNLSCVFFSRLLAIYGYFQKGMTKTNSSYSEEEEEEKRMYRLTVPNIYRRNLGNRVVAYVISVSPSLIYCTVFILARENYSLSTWLTACLLYIPAS